jgi:hypothetical protein
MITVVHVRKALCTLYIGREAKDCKASKWANPFHVGIDGNRFEVIEMYETYVRESPALMAALHELDNQILGCWCHPKACHGDVLKRLREEQLAIRRETISN